MVVHSGAHSTATNDYYNFFFFFMDGLSPQL